MAKGWSVARFAKCGTLLKLGAMLLVIKFLISWNAAVSVAADAKVLVSKECCSY